jgi:hypothetical protein
MLKFVETLHLLDQSRGDSAERIAELRRQATDSEKILALFRQGVLIMDEVDLILHPLKSGR